MVQMENLIDVAEKGGVVFFLGINLNESSAIG
jgi:hypothetical protein